MESVYAEKSEKKNLPFLILSRYVLLFFNITGGIEIFWLSRPHEAPPTVWLSELPESFLELPFLWAKLLSAIESLFRFFSVEELPSLPSSSLDSCQPDLFCPAGRMGVSIGGEPLYPFPSFKSYKDIGYPLLEFVILTLSFSLRISPCICFPFSDEVPFHKSV